MTGGSIGIGSKYVSGKEGEERRLVCMVGCCLL